MLDRKVAPPYNRNFSLHLIPVQKTNLDNGTIMYAVPGGDQNIVKIELVINAGTWNEPQTGVSHFTGLLLNKGIPTLSSYQIAEKLDQLGAHLEIIPSFDFVTVSLMVMNKKVNEALALLTQILWQPTFDEQELDQAKQIFNQNLKINKSKPSYLASQIFRNTLFGETHPYGKSIEEKNVDAITSDLLREFHHNYFSDYKIFVSGKVDTHLEKAIATLFSSFAYSPQKSSDVPTNYSAPTESYLPKKDSLQTALRLGKKALGRDHPDYAKVLLLNHILGGYFGSRLMTNIREEKGLTYGIYAGLNTLQKDSYQVIGTDVNKDNRVLAIEEIQKEIQKLSDETITDEELDTARCHLLGSTQSDLATTFAHADKYKSLVLLNLPENYYTQLMDDIQQITAHQLQATANQYFQVDSYSVIGVG